MTSNQRIDEFLKLQDKGISLDEIASTLGIKPQTLKRDLNKNGYKSNKGIYEKKVDDSQLSFSVLNTKNNSDKSKVKGSNKKTKDISKNKNESNKKESVKKKKTTTPKKDRKINISQEDLDKLCEVYDWYIEVRDNKALKPKKLSNKKDISLENENITDFKSVNIRVEKETWEDFERLCSNSSFNKKEIITQALKDFMKTYKNLL